MNNPESNRFTRPVVTRRSLLRGLRLLLAIAASLITLVALFYAEENWRGRRAWQAYKQRFEAGGMALDLKVPISSTIADEQNFAMIPFFKPLSLIDPGNQWWNDNETLKLSRKWDPFLTELTGPRLKALKPTVSPDRRGKMRGDWRLGRPRDVIANYLVHTWDTNNVARSMPDFDPTKVTIEEAGRGILENYAIVDPILDEIRSAAGRPYNRFSKYHNSLSGFDSLATPWPN